MLYKKTNQEMSFFHQPTKQQILLRVDFMVAIM